ncbi:MAG: beta-lactamase family protein [Deltaproteobacteria bacterium]|nr:beta-lactamase family protein [Deltaproteobacteria bacterium]
MAFSPIIRAGSLVSRVLLFFFLGLASCTLDLAPGVFDAATLPESGMSPDARRVPLDAAPSPDARRPRDAGPPPEGLDDFIRFEMAQGGIPGLAVAILASGDVAWQGLYGFADVEREMPVTERTLFGVGSVSKTLTLVSLLRLVESGQLDLDAPVDDLLPFAVRHPDYPAEPLSARMLVTHTSGMADNWLVLGGVTVEGRDNFLSLADFARGYVTPGGDYWSDTNFRAQPGTAWEYSNAAWAVVGALVEQAGGVPLRAATREQIFVPLGMDDSGFFLADVDASLLAVPYTYNRGRRRFDPLMQPGYGHWPATGLRTSVADLSRFALMLLGLGSYGGARVLDAATVEDAFALQVPSLSRRQALGFRYRTLTGRRYVGHSGATIGGSAQLLLLPAEGKGILLMTNGDSYVRSRFGFSQGADALERILERLDAESASY